MKYMVTVAFPKAVKSIGREERFETDDLTTVNETIRENHMHGFPRVYVNIREDGRTIKRYYIQRRGGVKSLEALCDYINNSDDFPTDVAEIIAQNGWKNDLNVQWGVCHNDRHRIVMNEEGKAVVVLNETSKSNRERIGQRIAELRAEKYMTQRDLAEKVGFTQSNIARIEQGKYSVGLDILEVIANALGCTVELVRKR